MREDILDELGRFNPFGIIGGVATDAAASAWVGAMMAIFDSGLWILRLCLSAVDAFLTPDLSEDGPAAQVYQTTFWGAGALVLLMAFWQIGLAAGKRDGKSLGKVFIGGAQFIAVWFCWITYGTVLVAACGGITHALMDAMLNVDSWSDWSPLPPESGVMLMLHGGVEAGMATVLAALGAFLWLAAIGHFVVMLIRGASLMILAATTPIAAAGLVSDAGQAWFWKSVRWFHAAALTPVLSVLVIGIGVKLCEGVGKNMEAGIDQTIGSMVPGVVIVVISLGSPVVLFRLLAFVDPGTSSGAQMRAGLQAVGGIGGLLGGQSSAGGGTSSTASSTAPSGQSEGEQQGSDATTSRLTGALAKMGGAYGQGMNKVAAMSGKLASTGADEMNQTAVGDGSYFPDYQRGPQSFNPDQRGDTGENNSPDHDRDSPNGGPAPSLPSAPSTSGAPSAPTPSLPGPGGPSGGGGAAGAGGAGGGGGAGAASAAGSVPPVA